MNRQERQEKAFNKIKAAFDVEDSKLYTLPIEESLLALGYHFDKDDINYEQYQELVKEHALRRPKEFAAIQEANTAAKLAVLDRMQFAEPRQESIDVPLQEGAFSANVPYGHENKSNLYQTNSLGAFFPNEDVIHIPGRVGDRTLTHESQHAILGTNEQEQRTLDYIQATEPDEVARAKAMLKAIGGLDVGTDAGRYKLAANALGVVERGREKGTLSGTEGGVDLHEELRTEHISPAEAKHLTREELNSLVNSAGYYNPVPHSGLRYSYKDLPDTGAYDSVADALRKNLAAILFK